ncbi:hypothetical protein DFJ58DRAFT_783100 [Suillus subalutaceus]|uniref:uncharacterized protein n=1 Tax=Suillus subalutaceus TaxID=48586 RepID=UPI001B86BDAB|nr:uncharacterized protein DFJ58DRAFT_783100 [Suillus subalutaceus]KAG1857728.1 hypothetical protein DFJ58DRAFT_783100 [Suillus subalutaceus]
MNRFFWSLNTPTMMAAAATFVASHNAGAVDSGASYDFKSCFVCKRLNGIYLFAFQCFALFSLSALRPQSLTFYLLFLLLWPLGPKFLWTYFFWIHLRIPSCLFDFFTLFIRLACTLTYMQTTWSHFVLISTP